MIQSLDEQCAALLDWHRGATGAINAGYGYGSSAYWYDADEQRCAPCITDGLANLRAFSPSSNHEDARLLDDRIEREELAGTYAAALCVVMGMNWPDPLIPAQRLTFAWRLIRATPEQKARAFLAVMERAPS